MHWRTFAAIVFFATVAEQTACKKWATSNETRMLLAKKEMTKKKTTNESIPKSLWAINVTVNNYQIRWKSIAIRVVQAKQHILICSNFFFVYLPICAMHSIKIQNEMKASIQFDVVLWRGKKTDTLITIFGLMVWQDQLLIWRMKTTALIIWHETVIVNEKKDKNLHGTLHCKTNSLFKFKQQRHVTR